MSESGKWRGIENKQEFNISSPEIIFGIDPSFEERIGSLGEAVSVSDFDTVKELLSSNKFVENIVIKKGKNKEWLKLLEQSVNTVAQTEIGKDVTSITDAKELERVIRSAKLPPFAVAELAGALYHLGRDDESERLVKSLGAVDISTVDAVTQANAFNTLGCVLLRQGDIKGSSDAHRAGLALLAGEKKDDPNVRWQTSKLKYGILIDKITRKVFPDTPEQLFALRREREELGDTFNIGRVDLDAARVFASLKKKDEATHYAERARDLMGSTGYWSGAQQAADLLEQLKRNH